MTFPKATDTQKERALQFFDGGTTEALDPDALEFAINQAQEANRAGLDEQEQLAHACRAYVCMTAAKNVFGEVK